LRVVVRELIDDRTRIRGLVDDRTRGKRPHDLRREVEESGEGESLEAELAEIMLVKIHGKLGGNGSQFELSSGARCKVVKINTTPATVKADGNAILSPEKNASVEVAPLKGATAAKCRKAAEFAIG
jgi:alpha-D-ribose 1-methylphosphonate 5-triphosphate synthase subunit PhnG